MAAIEGLVPPEGLEDDAAILALSRDPVPKALRLQLPAEPRVLAKTRRSVRRWLREQGAEGEELAAVTIAVNEACANAIEHAYPPGPATFELMAQADDGNVTITVRDSGRWREQRGSDRGRGVHMLKAAMDEVQINQIRTGTEVIMKRRLGPR